MSARRRCAVIGQVVSLLGAAMILAAFGAQQAGKLGPEAPLYLALNLAGSLILTYFAVEARNLGLIALEGSWAAISLVSLVRAAVRGSASPRP
jgi:hypothetical protein